MGRHRLRQTRTILNASVGSAGGFGYSALLKWRLTIALTSLLHPLFVSQAFTSVQNFDMQQFIRWASHPQCL